MPEDLDTEYEELTPGDLRRQLEDAKAQAKQAAEERDTAKAEAESAAREIAFEKAGIPPDAEFFRKHYDGPADPETIKTEAVNAKVIEAPPPDTPVEEMAAQQRVASAGAGAETPTVRTELTAKLEELQQVATQNPNNVSQAIAEFLRQNGEIVDEGVVVQAPDGQIGGVAPIS